MKKTVTFEIEVPDEANDIHLMDWLGKRLSPLRYSEHLENPLRGFTFETIRPTNISILTAPASEQVDWDNGGIFPALVEMLQMNLADGFKAANIMDYFRENFNVTRKNK